MKTLVKNKKDNRRVFSLKKSDSGHGSDTIFSYAIKSELPTITLQQRETGFSLTLEMEKLENVLRVTRFKLNVSPQLEKFSESLYHAALIEIVLQTLKSLSFYATRHEMDEILFVLPQEEAAQIICFDGLFGDTSSVTLGTEKCVSLTISCKFQDFFLKQVACIMAKIKLELWKEQREDLYLRNYLQAHKRGEPLFTTKAESQEDKNNVIAFPQRPKA